MIVAKTSIFFFDLQKMLLCVCTLFIFQSDLFRQRQSQGCADRYCLQFSLTFELFLTFSFFCLTGLDLCAVRALFRQLETKCLLVCVCVCVFCKVVSANLQVRMYTVQCLIYSGGHEGGRK